MRRHRLRRLSDEQDGKESGIGAKHWDCSLLCRGLEDWSKTLGLADALLRMATLLILIIWWTRTISDHESKLCCIDKVKKKTWLTPWKRYQALLKMQFQIRFHQNLLKTTDDRIACSLISAVDILEAESSPEIPRGIDSAFSNGCWWMWLLPISQFTFSHQSMIFHFLSPFFALSDDVVDCGEHPE